MRRLDNDAKAEQRRRYYDNNNNNKPEEEEVGGPVGRGRHGRRQPSLADGADRAAPYARLGLSASPIAHVRSRGDLAPSAVQAHTAFRPGRSQGPGPASDHRAHHLHRTARASTLAARVRGCLGPAPVARRCTTATIITTTAVNNNNNNGAVTTTTAIH